MNNPTNLADVYGMADGQRVSLSSGANTALAGCYSIGATADADGIIPIENGDVFRIKGATFPNTATSGSTICFYTSLDGTHVDQAGIYLHKDASLGSSHSLGYDEESDIITYVVMDKRLNAGIRFSLPCNNPEELIITKNELI